MVHAREHEMWWIWRLNEHRCICHIALGEMIEPNVPVRHRARQEASELSAGSIGKDDGPSRDLPGYTQAAADVYLVGAEVLEIVLIVLAAGTAQ